MVLTLLQKIKKITTKNQKTAETKESWWKADQRIRGSAPFSWWLSQFGGGTVTPVGRVSTSPWESMSKETWEGSPSPRHTLPRCTLHLSGTSAVATKGLQDWWNSWAVWTLVLALCERTGVYWWIEMKGYMHASTCFRKLNCPYLLEELVLYTLQYRALWGDCLLQFGSCCDLAAYK